MQFKKMGRYIAPILVKEENRNKLRQNNNTRNSQSVDSVGQSENDGRGSDRR
jgi:hypothetical protein